MFIPIPRYGDLIGMWWDFVLNTSKKVLSDFDVHTARVENHEPC